MFLPASELQDDEDRKKEKRKKKAELKELKTKSDDESDDGGDGDDEGGWETVKKGSSMPVEKPKMFGKVNQ